MITKWLVEGRRSQIMDLSKKINYKLITISLLFMLMFVLSTNILIGKILDSVITLTADVHYNQVSHQLRKDFEILKDSVETIATDKQVIGILEGNKSVEQLDQADKEVISWSENLYNDILEAMPFIKSPIGIVSFPGHYAFSNGTLYENYDFFNREWVKKAKGHRESQSFVTEIYSDFITGKETISIGSLVYGTNKKEPLGAIIIDIYADSFLDYVSNTFYSGRLEVEFLKEDEKSESFMIQNIQKGYYTRELNGLLPDYKLMFSFDKESIKQNDLIAGSVEVIELVIVSVGIFGAICLIVAIYIAFEPALKSIRKLKKIIVQLNQDNDFLNEKNEFVQLELMADVLGKTFDDKIESLIYYDSLTGLPNRKKLHLLCEELIEQNQPFALIFVDMNKFKMVNDIFGHTIGDRLLIRFSHITQRALGKRGIVTRYSGDEFVIIYKNYTNDAEFEFYYRNKIVPLFHLPVELMPDVKVFIEFSIGAAVFPRDGLEVSELVQKSDLMMYKNKSAGLRDKLIFFNDDVYKDLVYIENLKNELRTALLRDELTIVYQPIIDQQQRIVKAEALLRWKNEKLGNVSPQDFISYAEETREIIPIGCWVIEEVCRFIKDHQSSIEISINVSPIQLLEVDFFNCVEAMVEKYQIPFEQLSFELTESVLLEKSEALTQNLHNLRQKGCKILLDDFGTGYSSFSYLQRYPIDIVKLDRVFLSGTDEKDYMIISHINKIADLLNMKVIIEGVETETQFNTLVEIGCEMFQGYYFSRPLSEQNFIKLIKI